MLTSRIRVLVLGLLAVMLAGAIMTAPASAGEGPFWHHRPIGGKGEGEKIPAEHPEQASGEGGKQTLLGEIEEAKGVKTPIEITATRTQVKADFSNGIHQGQIKLIIGYQEPKLVKPALSGCTVTVGEKNLVQVKGHLAWKWDGTHPQLIAQNQVLAGQTWDIVFTPIEPQRQSPYKEKLEYDSGAVGTFVTVTLKGVGCGVLAGIFPVSGSEVGIPNRGIEEWSRTLSVRTMPPQKKFIWQHIWVGGGGLEEEEVQGLEVGLLFDQLPASLIGQTETESAQQEIAVFEKK